MRCALRELTRTPCFDRLVLSGSLDVAYEGSCVLVLRDLAEVVRLCHEGAAPEDERNCSGCDSRPSDVLGRLADSIPYQWDGALKRSRPVRTKVKCASCWEKVDEVRSMVLAKMHQIERSSSRGAFKVVGESGNT